jgi:poly(3-hydroxybutyrate) depolymerase
MRQNDAGYAIRKVKQLSWVDADNVFLMGLSQGGITAATFHSEHPAARVRARVVEGWTCHAGWEEYRGINAPETEPVLSLVGERDPWFQNAFNHGDCGTLLNSNNGSKSVVYRTGRLRDRHELLEDKSAQQTVLAFLRKHTLN